jgi:uncharacterized phiE125 gp8 family phage protein
MKLISRTPLTNAAPFNSLDVADYVRVDGFEAIAAAAFAEAAAAEIEAYCGLALLEQTIVAETADWPGSTLHLPIGPAAPDASVTVHLIEADGTLTEITEGWTLTGGRYPVVTFTTTPGGRLRVTYRASYGPNADALPRDLHMAVLDQALRLYDRRGDLDGPATLSPAAARICARYRRVAIA